MRQTSRAVALLLTLESAQAANRPIILNKPTPAAGTGVSENAFNVAAATIKLPATLLNSRTAPYSNTQPATVIGEQETGATWHTPLYQKHKAGSSATAGDMISGSSCMACINGLGVWCSRTYSYLESGLSYQFEATGYAAGQMKQLSSTDASSTGGAALDQGACCNSAALFSTFVGTLSVPSDAFTEPTSAESIAGMVMLAEACPAMAGNTWTDNSSTTYQFGTTSLALEETTTLWTSWWCSNGLYKKVTGSSASTQNTQQIIPQGTNKRQELAQIGCPQKAQACGQTTDGSDFVVALTTGSPTKTYPMKINGSTGEAMTVDDKCTWVAMSIELAPTFTMEDSSLGTFLGLTSGAYQIHNMEYTSAATWTLEQQSLNPSAAAGTNDGFQQLAPALSMTTMLPLFWMPAVQFSSLRTWYGQGSDSKDDTSGYSANWMSPGQAPINNTKAISLQLAGVKSQLYGNVANIPMSANVVSTTTTALGATENYGKYNNVYFDLRQMRYFPAKVAQTVWTAGSALALQYSTALSTYNTAKTTWDAYVAILEKNAKQDAFAALFSPPKAPTVPPLPNMPWVPATYNGYVRATAAETAAYAASPAVPTAAASPTAQQFWTSLSAAQSSGGWGSFTATIFTYRNGWGKSFGTIGYSGDQDRLKMSDVWNYKWTCTAASAAGAAASTSSQCANTYTATAGSAASAGTETSANAVKMITIVSLWATSNANAGSQEGTAMVKSNWLVNGFQITFTGSAWQSGIVGLTAIAAATTPAAAKGLTGIAGAQALAATSAAALAVAAALY